MNIIRKTELSDQKPIIGDQIKVGKYTATCQMIYRDKALFCLDQYLDKDYPMNLKATNDGGYEESYLRKILNSNILEDENFKEISENLIPFENGDLLRIPTVLEFFGSEEDEYYDTELDGAIMQWPLMKDIRNRIALRNNDYEWGWLQNKVKMSATNFAAVNSSGNAYCYYASYSLGVRPVFQLLMRKENK